MRPFALAGVALMAALMFAETGCAGGSPAGGGAMSSAVEMAPPAAATGGFDGANAYAHTAMLVGFGPRPPASEGIHRAQDYIRSQLKSFGCAVEEDDFHANTPIGSVAMKNIVAKAPGDRSKVILLLTHYDTLRLDNFVGAVDGASSTGLMLEMARLVCGRKNVMSVWIGFLDGEEAFVQWSNTDSTYGSREMAARMAASGELARVSAVLLADMVGPKNLRIVRDTNSTKWLTDLVWDTAKRLGYGGVFVNQDTAVEDDHMPFTRRNVPAVDVIDLADYPYWHTPQDTLDKVSAKSLAIVGHVFIESLNQIPSHVH